MTARKFYSRENQFAQLFRVSQLGNDFKFKHLKWGFSSIQNLLPYVYTIYKEIKCQKEALVFVNITLWNSCFLENNNKKLVFS